MENKRAANYSKILNKHHLKVQVCIEKKKRVREEEKPQGGKARENGKGRTTYLSINFPTEFAPKFLYLT